MSATDVIVLVGGMGTRLRSVVPDLPKPMAPVAGRPFLAHLLDGYAYAGMRRVILATGYRADQIEDVIGPRWRGMDVVYSREDKPLGTGGAVRQAAQLVDGDGVHLANGDTFLRYHPAALEASTRALDAPLGIALAHVPDVGRYGAVEVRDGRLSAFHEKGGHGAGWINAGSYFLPAQSLRLLPLDQAFSFEESVLFPWTAQGRVAAFMETDDFIDIGVPEDYARAQELLKASGG